jgi:hypothetical protein
MHKLIVSHVDMHHGRPKDAIEQFKIDVKTRFNISDLGLLKKHLGIWYEWKGKKWRNIH